MKTRGVRQKANPVAAPIDRAGHSAHSQSLIAFLSSQQLQGYGHLLAVEHGLCSLHALATHVLDEKDLTDIGIRPFAHRRALWTAIQKHRKLWLTFPEAEEEIHATHNVHEVPAATAGTSTEPSSVLPGLISSTAEVVHPSSFSQTLAAFRLQVQRPAPNLLVNIDSRPVPALSEMLIRATAEDDVTRPTVRLHPPMHPPYEEEVNNAHLEELPSNTHRRQASPSLPNNAVAVLSANTPSQRCSQEVSAVHQEQMMPISEWERRKKSVKHTNTECNVKMTHSQRSDKGDDCASVCDAEYDEYLKHVNELVDEAKTVAAILSDELRNRVALANQTLMHKWSDIERCFGRHRTHRRGSLLEAVQLSVGVQWEPPMVEQTPETEIEKHMEARHPLTPSQCDNCVASNTTSLPARQGSVRERGCEGRSTLGGVIESPSPHDTCSPSIVGDAVITSQSLKRLSGMQKPSTSASRVEYWLLDGQLATAAAGSAPSQPAEIATTKPVDIGGDNVFEIVSSSDGGTHHDPSQQPQMDMEVDGNSILREERVITTTQDYGGIPEELEHISCSQQVALLEIQRTTRRHSRREALAEEHLAPSSCMDNAFIDVDAFLSSSDDTDEEMCGPRRSQEVRHSGQKQRFSLRGIPQEICNEEEQLQIYDEMQSEENGSYYDYEAEIDMADSSFFCSDMMLSQDVENGCRTPGLANDTATRFDGILNDSNQSLVLLDTSETSVCVPGDDRIAVPKGLPPRSPPPRTASYQTHSETQEGSFAGLLRNVWAQQDETAVLFHTQRSRDAIERMSEVDAESLCNQFGLVFSSKRKRPRDEDDDCEDWFQAMLDDDSVNAPQECNQSISSTLPEAKDALLLLRARSAFFSAMKTITENIPSVSGISVKGRSLPRKLKEAEQEALTQAELDESRRRLRTAEHQRVKEHIVCTLIADAMEHTHREQPAHPGGREHDPSMMTTYETVLLREGICFDRIARLVQEEIPQLPKARLVELLKQQGVPLDVERDSPEAKKRHRFFTNKAGKGIGWRRTQQQR